MLRRPLNHHLPIALLPFQRRARHQAQQTPNRYRNGNLALRGEFGLYLNHAVIVIYYRGKSQC